LWIIDQFADALIVYQINNFVAFTEKPMGPEQFLNLVVGVLGKIKPSRFTKNLKHGLQRMIWGFTKNYK